MKTIIKYSAILALVLSNTFSYSSSNINLSENPVSKDTNICLVVVGKILKTDKKTKQKYLVELVDNNIILDSKLILPGHDFNFYLKKNKWYAVKISMNGFVPKYVSISTNNLTGMNKGGIYIVNFDLAEPLSYAEANYLDADALDFPLAIISYNAYNDFFDYNDEYTKNIKNKLTEKLVYEDYLIN